MSTEFADASLAQIGDVVSRLQSPVQDLPTLLALLTAPLSSLRLLPPQYFRYNISPLTGGTFNVSKHIPALQRALLEQVIPAWETILMEKHMHSLVEQFFCPDLFSSASPSAGKVALHAYSTILSLPLTEYSIRILVRLSKFYPIDVLHTIVFSGTPDRHAIPWEDCVRNVAAVPGKVANACNGKGITPPELEYGSYFTNLSVRCEALISSLSGNISREDTASVTYLFTKLVNIGLFPPSIPTSPSQASFFQATLPTIRSRLASSSSYGSVWPTLIFGLSSTLTLQAIMTSLFSHLQVVSDLDSTPQIRRLVKKEGSLLEGILGKLAKNNSQLWDGVSSVVLGREWRIGHGRIFVCWIAGREGENKEALELILSKVVDLWTTPDHIKHSLLSNHHYVTALLLIVLSYLSAPTVKSTAVNSLALSPTFVTSISTYISHLDPSVRRCGMLVAEEVAHGSGKKLDFGDWEGEKDGRTWCRAVRELTKQRDVDVEVELDSSYETQEEAPMEEGEKNASVTQSRDTPQTGIKSRSRKPIIETAIEGYDSDDSLMGYGSSPSSSRSPSPTPSELEEIEKDPTLRVGRKKVVRPVYLAQLGEMVRPTSGLASDNEEGLAETIEVALEVAEELIRKKRSYGTELEENAVNLVYGFVCLQDNYDLERFSEKRQAALNALVACCPGKAAPALAEEFFKNQYSTDQRYTILNALALGARELACLPIPPTPAVEAKPTQRLTFPSKRLPPALHDKYITQGDQLTTLVPVQNLLEDISTEAINKSRDATAEKVPEYVRERHLRIRQPAKVTEVKSGSLSRQQLQPRQMMPAPVTTFTEVAAECFICPLINRFWLFLRDEQTREAQTAHQGALHRYTGAGTGLILNAVVLSHFLATMAVLVHAARNAKEWLAVIAPDALELAVTMGTRPVSRGEGQDEGEDEDIDVQINSEPSGKEKGKGKEAAVLTTSLELALVVLDGCADLDGGRSMSLEHTALVLGAGEWAEEILSRLEKGTRVLGGGGMQEVRLKRAAAGVILKVDEVTSRWKRSMIEI